MILYIKILNEGKSIGNKDEIGFCVVKTKRKIIIINIHIGYTLPIPYLYIFWLQLFTILETVNLNPSRAK